MELFILANYKKYPRSTAERCRTSNSICLKSMKYFILSLVLLSSSFSAQSVAAKLDNAVKKVLNTPQGYAASLSVYVADKNGNLIYEYNGNQGLSTASTQKIFTAAAALETLGQNYQYTTTAAFSGDIADQTLNGNIYITSTGDPTLGSWRYEGYGPQNFLQRLSDAIKAQKIKTISGNLIIDDSYFDFQNVPGGWPWNDMGNYYGAGVWGVNWRENQFDLHMNGKVMKNTNVTLPDVTWVNDLSTAGTSDQSIIYTAPHSPVAYIQGSLPAKNITVSGAMPNPPRTLGEEIKKYLDEKGIIFKGRVITTSEQRISGEKPTEFPKNRFLLTYQSPPLDKIVYWFLKKSVNLYGETLIKTMGREKTGRGSFSAGIGYLKDFWKAKGIHPAMINFADGSGLSPQNYVSAHAEVQALQWSQKQPWFGVFLDAFPVQSNGMRMKSGTMRDVKSFAGYHNGYVFSAIINNYQGASTDALFQILNQLK